MPQAIQEQIPWNQVVCGSEGLDEEKEFTSFALDPFNIVLPFATDGMILMRLIFGTLDILIPWTRQLERFFPNSDIRVFLSTFGDGFIFGEDNLEYCVSGLTTRIPSELSSGIRAMRDRDIAVRSDVFNELPPYNSPPVFLGIAGVLIAEDSGVFDIALFNAFEDPDHDFQDLTITAIEVPFTSTLLSTVQILPTGVLRIEPALNAFGFTQVQVTATDVLGAFTSGIFTIEITAVNDPPTIATALPDFMINENSPGIVVDFSSYFTDADLPLDMLTYTIQTNTNPGLGSSSILGNQLTFIPDPDEFGVVDLTIRATDEGLDFIEDTMRITVQSTNSPPVLSTPILDQNVDEDDPDIIIDMDSHFTDPDVSDTLTYQLLSNDNPTLISPSQLGSVFTFSLAPEASGTANILIRAEDNELSAAFAPFAINVASVNDPSVPFVFEGANFGRFTGRVDLNFTTFFDDVDGYISPTISCSTSSPQFPCTVLADDVTVRLRVLNNAAAVTGNYTVTVTDPPNGPINCIIPVTRDTAIQKLLNIAPGQNVSFDLDVEMADIMTINPGSMTYSIIYTRNIPGGDLSSAVVVGTSLDVVGSSGPTSRVVVLGHNSVTDTYGMTAFVFT